MRDFAEHQLSLKPDSLGAQTSAQSSRPRFRRFTARYLDPASRLGEILFGLIMVLTVTLTAGLTVAEGPEGVRQLLIAAIGCNIAWGIIDAVMYIMDSVTVRTGKLRLIEAVQRAPNATETLELLENEIEPELQELIDPAAGKALSRSVLRHISEGNIVARKTLTRDDLLGGLACFWLVFVLCLPAALPFLIFSSPTLALRVSNFLLIALLYLVGRKWARYARTDRFVTGSLMVAIGLALVGVAILLGG